jgi:hypothetical protein
VGCGWAVWANTQATQAESQAKRTRLGERGAKEGQGMAKGWPRDGKDVQDVQDKVPRAKTDPI